MFLKDLIDCMLDRKVLISLRQLIGRDHDTSKIVRRIVASVVIPSHPLLELSERIKRVVRSRQS